MAQTKIKGTIRRQLRKNHEFQAAMVREWKVSIRTVERWIDGDNEKLTSPATMRLIEQHTGLGASEIIQSKPIKA